jgi:hypothetical protein
MRGRNAFAVGDQQARPHVARVRLEIDRTYRDSPRAADRLELALESIDVDRGFHVRTLQHLSSQAATPEA